MRTIAIYPGTFDPITNGHQDLVHRAARLFTHVIVAVAESSAKNTRFDIQSRVEFARISLADRPNVEVDSFSGLLVHFAQARGASVILRGLRAISRLRLRVPACRHESPSRPRRGNGMPHFRRAIQLHLLQPGPGDRDPRRRRQPFRASHGGGRASRVVSGTGSGRTRCFPPCRNAFRSEADARGPDSAGEVHSMTAEPCFAPGRWVAEAPVSMGSIAASGRG